jgi:hypothetical protein
MITGAEVTRVVELEEAWEDAATDANDENSPGAETDAATVLSLSLLSEIAQTPAANMTDVAVKIGIAARDLRSRLSDPMIMLLLESAEQDCLLLARAALLEHA